jgi:Flp pilus assembly protein TadG
LALSSERGTVTAELAIALPAVLVVLVFSLNVLGVQVERLSLVAALATDVRAAARGELVKGTKLEGNLICLSRTTKSLIPIVEKQCARRLGL